MRVKAKWRANGETENEKITKKKGKGLPLANHRRPTISNPQFPSSDLMNPKQKRENDRMKSSNSHTRK